MILFIPLIVVATSIWVLIDSSNIGAHRDPALGMAGTSPAAWFFGSLLFWIIVFPLYLAQRERIKATAATGTRPCPRCAEDIKAAAKVCRFCGFELPET